MWRPCRGLTVFAAALALLAMRSGALAIVVTSCGTSVPAGDVGDLANDLDCTTGPGHCADDPSVSCSSAAGAFVDCPTSMCVRYGVHLAPNARLEMNGHTISGGDYGVLCRDFGCTVDGGGGTIANEEFSAVWLFGGGKLVINDLTIHDTFRTAVGVAYFARKLVLRNVDGYNIAGIEASVDVDATNVTLAGSRPGGCGFDADLQGRRVRATNVSVSFIGAERLRGRQLTVAASCGDGIRVTGNTRLMDSSITGAQNVDVLTGLRPRLVRTSCGTSAQLLPDGTTGPTWGVCAGD
jgi:hypothetical protein